jgi:DNA-binding CsgD family transcriptional regulator
MDLKPISIDEFNKSMTREINEEDKIDFENYFKPCIEQASKFAVAPYFWLIPNQENMSLVAASSNIRDLTPHTKEEWIKEDSFFWMNNFHPDDQGFLGAAITLAVKIQEEMPFEKVQGIRLNIYCRMLDANNKYRWVLIQFPERYFDKNGKICSTLILTTDLSHLTVELKCTMTLIDLSEKEFKFFSTAVDTQKVTPLNLASISKREHQILLLMAKGLNSPQIAEKLFISYHTVENHKRNLRQKTNTKTSAELVHYVWSNNLI